MARGLSIYSSAEVILGLRSFYIHVCTEYTNELSDQLVHSVYALFLPLFRLLMHTDPIRAFDPMLGTSSPVGGGVRAYDKEGISSVLLCAEL